MYSIAAAMAVWTAFSAYRLFSLMRLKGYRAAAAECDREDSGFWLGAILSSVILSVLFLFTPTGVL